VFSSDLRAAVLVLIAAACWSPATVLAQPGDVGSVCPTASEQLRVSLRYPAEAMHCRLEGEVVVQFTVERTGGIKDPIIRRSTNRAFHRAALAAVAELRCLPRERPLRAEIPIDFRISRFGDFDQMEAQACMERWAREGTRPPSPRATPMDDVKP
jgi:TonB family protein